MLKTEQLPDGRTLTRSDAGMLIRQEGGVLYEDAADTVAHTYEETDLPIPCVGEAEPEDYENALEVLGV